MIIVLVMNKLIFAVMLVFVIATPAYAQNVKINFTPASDQFKPAAKEYEVLWKAEGDRIIQAIEKVSGLKFKETEFTAIVFEGVSRSGRPGGSPMKLRASYPADTKKATLIHEIGHRHISQLDKRPEGVDEHSVLFLVLYDIWLDLYGRKFADEQVEVEKARRGPYPAAWTYALGMTRKEREKKFKEIVDQNRGLVSSQISAATAPGSKPDRLPLRIRRLHQSSYSVEHDLESIIVLLL